MRTLWIIITLATLPLGFANASTIRMASLEELVRNSSLIAVATVTAKLSFWQDNRIYTRNAFTLDSIWYQTPPKEPVEDPPPTQPTHIEVDTLGGVVGALGQHVAGSPTLHINSTYVLFITPGEHSNWFITGLSQGAIKVQNERLIPLPESSHSTLTSNSPKALTSLDSLQKAVRQITERKP